EAEYTSYSADGQVAQMKLGNGNIQTVDYTYTAQGWLDKMNAGTVSSGTNGDRFALDLDYADNGNITLQKWMQSSLSTTNSVQYAYTYDKANRLTAANYTNNNSSATDDNNNGYDISPITYDKSGNIASIIRKGVGYYAYPDNSITSTTISSGSNRMTSYGLQNGPTPTSTKTVTYDANGNMLQNRFTNGVYNGKNLMTSVKSGTTTIQFGYDADGNRVRKEVVGGTESTYVRGADGQTIAVYENGSRAFVNLLAGGQMLGNYDGSQRRYFLKDHLGTVRTTIDQSGNVDGYDDYFPFGLVMSGRSNNTSNPDDLYKFTGHERDDEAGLNLDYMMARNYDPVIGSFIQIDPHFSSYPDWSPYTYTFNNPLLFTDPSGMDPWPTWANLKEGVRRTANQAKQIVSEKIDNYVNYANSFDLSKGDEWGRLVADHVPFVSYDNAELTFDNPVQTVEAVADEVSVQYATFVEGDNDAKAVVLLTSVILLTEYAISKKGRRPDGRAGSTIANENGVTIKSYGTNDVHKPAHAHVIGGGEQVRIGPNGKPLKGQPELSNTQQSVVTNNKKAIRKEVNKVGRANQALEEYDRKQ
ncbi:MAG: RHS repeat-associated core domain-containing protein, partial [Balneolaceae bacterium]